MKNKIIYLFFNSDKKKTIRDDENMIQLIYIFQSMIQIIIIFN